MGISKEKLEATSGTDYLPRKTGIPKIPTKISNIKNDRKGPKSDFPADLNNF